MCVYLCKPYTYMRACLKLWGWVHSCIWYMWFHASAERKKKRAILGILEAGSRNISSSLSQYFQYGISTGKGHSVPISRPIPPLTWTRSSSILHQEIECPLAESRQWARQSWPYPEVKFVNMRKRTGNPDPFKNKQVAIDKACLETDKTHKSSGLSL